MTVSPSSAKAADKLLTVDEALERILAGVRPLPAREVALLEALGRTLAAEVVADRDIPPFRNSAMDGYAVRGEDVATAPARLRVVGAVAAGGMPERAVGRGEAMRIMTGAPMPDGADTVVRVEDTDNADDVVTVTAATPRGLSVRQAGEDLARGTTILRAGDVLRPAEIGLLASLGVSRPRVVARPRVAVLSTGDEIVEITETPGPGKIRDANRYSVGSAVLAAACEPWLRPLVRDTPDALRSALRDAMSADAIVTSGGVSVGDHDWVKPIVSELGTLDVWAIAIRPGRPLAFAQLRGGDRVVPLFGLPGNPVSALLTFELFVRPALLAMSGRRKLHRPRARAKLLDELDKPGFLRFFARAIYDAVAGTVRLTGPQGSGILRSMSLANCLIDAPPGPSTIAAGESVDVILTDLPEDH
ncbi:MAG: molybdopterin molybdotransferase MoeA [Chloroflexota bacterium]|nr:molybdopterin molybdotransferase MoeA [Chloroflexota bacterium]MDE3192651.1 molybdopterin molybdotransferase MoeA [Chloroflexota bacterium]